MAFSYNLSNRHVTERYLSDTLAPGYATHFDLDVSGSAVSILTLLESARSRNEVPDIIAHLVHTYGLPRDLQRSPVPTASLDIDSFWWTSSRVRWSMLFDYVFVWHPSLAPLYRAAGHPKVFVFPHAVDEGLFQLDPDSESRTLDLGWVGGFGYAQYDQRKRIIHPLASRFRMNDPARRYSKQETAEIYQQSRIVVNVSRSDFPQEANMRCYEAMAGGALLMTGMPTELTEWGFREGEHFVGWRDEAEIPDLVNSYLRQKQKRSEIARSGRRLTLRDFTFQKCRDRMASIFQEHPGEFFAPARNWPPEKVQLLYLEYYYRYQLFEAALAEFGALRSLGAYWKGLPMILKTMRHRLKRLI
jgi:glycosyltransferase involved in cell wall biosynthesis